MYTYTNTYIGVLLLNLTVGFFKGVRRRISYWLGKERFPFTITLYIVVVNQNRKHLKYSYLNVSDL